MSTHVTDFNARNKILAGKLLHQGYQYHKLRKTVSKFYRQHYELVSKFKVGLKSLLQQDLSIGTRIYADLVYILKKNVSPIGLIFLISSKNNHALQTHWI